MENDLTKICNSIPVSNSGDISTQASSILQGLTGEIAEFHIGGGDQPTLFAPTVRLAFNSVDWTASSSNGGFSTQTVGYIDDVVYTPPISITESMNGKVLIVSTTAENFKPGITTTVLHYESPDYVSWDATGLHTFVSGLVQSDDHVFYVIRKGGGVSNYDPRFMQADGTIAESIQFIQPMCLTGWDGTKCYMPGSFDFTMIVISAISINSTFPVAVIAGRNITGSEVGSSIPITPNTLLDNVDHPYDSWVGGAVSLHSITGTSSLIRDGATIATGTLNIGSGSIIRIGMSGQHSAQPGDIIKLTISSLS